MQFEFKGILRLFIIVFLVCVLGTIFAFKAVFNSNTMKTMKKIEELTADFYENAYYPTTSKENLIKLEGNSIYFSLEEMLIYKEVPEDDEMYNHNAEIAVTPEPPYGKKDYSIQINLDLK